MLRCYISPIIIYIYMYITEYKEIKTVLVLVGSFSLMVTS